MSNGGLLTHPSLLQHAIDCVRNPAEGGTENPLEWWRYVQGSPIQAQPDDSQVETDGLHDVTALVRAETGIAHPYLLVDTEIYHREHVATIRDALSTACHEAWKQDAVGGPVRSEPLPSVEAGMTQKEVRAVLLEHQKSDRKTAAIMQQIIDVLDGGTQRK